MSEGQEWQQPEPPVEGPTAGTLLRRAREASGLHVAALAVSLKVPVRKLEALEDDRYDDLTDAVFIRGLASSVCRALKIDPQPIMERLPQTSAPRLIRNSDGINAPFRAPSDGAPPGWVDQLTKPVFLAVFALLLGALVLILLPTVKDDKPAQASVPVAQPQPAAAPVFVPVAAAPQPAKPVAVATAPAPAVAAASAPVAAPAPAPPAALATGGTVVIRAKAESWVEVTDARGVVAVRKILIPGEAAAASGALPLQVTIGRVDAIEVQVRGKPFDLRPVSKDNVARFEVK